MCIIDGRKHFFCIFHVAAYQKHRGQTYVHFSKKQKIFRNFVFCAFYTKNSQVLSFEKGGFTLEFQADERCNVGANVQFQWTSKPLESSPEVDLVDFYQKSSMYLVCVGQPLGVLVLRWFLQSSKTNLPTSGDSNASHSVSKGLDFVKWEQMSSSNGIPGVWKVPQKWT